jgi:hypothetical protein
VPDAVWDDDDQKSYKAMKDLYPEAADAFDRRERFIRQDLEARFSRTMYKVLEKVYSDMAPIAASASRVEQNSFRAYVLDKHKDFDTVKPALTAWIDTNPAYLRDAFKRVHDEGTAEEVVDLVTRFKAMTGVKPEVPSPSPQSLTTTPAPAATPAQPNPKAEALAPVTSKRSTPAPKGEDLTDFDGAFAEAASLLTPQKK